MNRYRGRLRPSCRAVRLIFIWTLALGFVLTAIFIRPGISGPQGILESPPPGVRTLRGHIRTVFAVAFSPDGKRLASGAMDNTTILWDVESAKQLRTLRHASPVGTVRFSPDGATVASALFEERLVRLWDVRTGRVKRTFGPYQGIAEDVNDVVFAPDGRTIITAATNGKIRLIDVRTGVVRRVLMGCHAVYSLALTPDGSILASGEHNGAGLWDLRRGVLIKRLGERPGIDPRFDHEFEVVALSPNGQWLATSSRTDEHELTLWNVPHRTKVKRLSRGDGIGDMAFSPDNETLAVGSDHKVMLLDVRTGVARETLELPNITYSVSFSPRGDTLAFSNQGLVLLWAVGRRQ